MEDGIESNRVILYDFKEKDQLNNYLYICIPENGLLENYVITEKLQQNI